MTRSLFTATFAALFAALVPFAAQAQTSPSYVDVSSYALPDAQYEGWINLRINLKRDFDQICGDTFCEGDFTNIEPLSFRCSVDQASGRVGMCAWIFAASNEEIDPYTGRISVSQRGFWRCRTPLAVGTTIDQFIDALQGDQPLYAPLPNSTRTIMDGLIDCL
ncbi:MULTISPECIES: hypothetical protein [unclassified Lysobacter]|uniref:hypothetical protein n=1 Tax=unclassified Lysobacter TaxID=2635362 RepID=UPI001F5904B9|nr:MULTISPECIES: hypothetical protein [unclassified Lysobacter]